MGDEAGKSVVRFCVRFCDLRTEMDVNETDGRRNEHSEDVLCYIYIVEHRVTGLTAELIVYSELNISQQCLCITSLIRTKKFWKLS